MVLRRTFLKNVGSLTCSAAFVGAAEGRPKIMATLQRINLIFHGPFAFIVDSSIQRIRVLTPRNHDHSFCWYDGKTYIRMKGAYELMGKLQAGDPTPDATKSIVISGAKCGSFKAQDAGTAPGYCSFKLPYPTSPAYPVRSVIGGDAQNVHFYGKYANTIYAQQFPLLHMFSYTVQDPATVVLKAYESQYQDWTPDPNLTFANLHIFAEPPCGVDESHGQVAFTSLVGLIHPNVADLFCRIFPVIYPPDWRKPTGLSDLTSPETESLEERCYDMGLCPTRLPSAGIRIVNCMSAFVTD